MKISMLPEPTDLLMLMLILVLTTDGKEKDSDIDDFMKYTSHIFLHSDGYAQVSFQTLYNGRHD